MALLFRRSQALLLLAPKTGSTWIREKVRQLDLDVVNIGDPAMRDHDFLDHYDRSRFRYIGAFVRDPLEWYRSYWAYRMERGWRPQYPLDKHCQSDDFEMFVRNAFSILPGALSNIYSSYVGKPSDEIDFIGRQEQLADDFASFLRLIGEVADESALRSGARVNATTIRPDYPSELKDLITLSEWDSMRRFGYLNGRPDPIDLAEMQARFPRDAEDHRLLAMWTYRIHWAPDDAKKRAGHTVRAQTRHARVHGNFALLAEHKYRDPEYAEERYRRAIGLDPHHPRTLCNYGLFAWRHRNDPHQARRLMLRSLSARPEHPYTLGKLARLTDRALGDPELAEVFYRQSLIGNDRQEGVLVELADLFTRSGQPQRAIDLLRSHTERPNAGRRTFLALAVTLASIGNAEGARSYQLRAAELAAQGEPRADHTPSHPIPSTLGSDSSMSVDAGLSADQILNSYVDAKGVRISAVADAARSVLDRQRICLIRGFTLDPDIYLEFLSHFGTPLSNYSSRSDLNKQDPHPQINLVKYKPKGQYVKHSVHYVAGGLRPHSARSWCTPRPAYFAMLMVNSGWRDMAPGERGESVVLSWSQLFAQLAERDGDIFAQHFGELTGTPIRFEANNVREELSELPLCYPLPDRAGPYDVGVRFKQDFQEKLSGLAEQFPDPERYRRAVDYLVENAADEKFQMSFPLDSGDLLLLDNNRFGHGRRTIIGERPAGGETVINPRELWSVTVR